MQTSCSEAQQHARGSCSSRCVGPNVGEQTRACIIIECDIVARSALVKAALLVAPVTLTLILGSLVIATLQIPQLLYDVYRTLIRCVVAPYVQTGVVMHAQSLREHKRCAARRWVVDCMAIHTAMACNTQYDDTFQKNRAKFGCRCSPYCVWACVGLCVPVALCMGKRSSLALQPAAENPQVSQKYGEWCSTGIVDTMQAVYAHLQAVHDLHEHQIPLTIRQMRSDTSVRRCYKH